MAKGQLLHLTDKTQTAVLEATKEASRLMEAALPFTPGDEKNLASEEAPAKDDPDKAHQVESPPWADTDKSSAPSPLESTGYDTMALDEHLKALMAKREELLLRLGLVRCSLVGLEDRVRSGLSYVTSSSLMPWTVGRH